MFENGNPSDFFGKEQKKKKEKQKEGKNEEKNRL